MESVGRSSSFIDDVGVDLVHEVFLFAPLYATRLQNKVQAPPT